MKSYKDVYEMPLHKMGHSSWVMDAKSRFVFQFEPKFTDKGDYELGWEKFEEEILNCLNSIAPMPNTGLDFKHLEGVIYKGIMPVITIRGWGYLTGTGGLRLPAEEAANIQDTFAQFIVDTLNK